MTARSPNSDSMAAKKGVEAAELEDGRRRANATSRKPVTLSPGSSGTLPTLPSSAIQNRADSEYVSTSC
jgi:hypothetical protein